MFINIQFRTREQQKGTQKSAKKRRMTPVKKSRIAEASFVNSIERVPSGRVSQE